MATVNPEITKVFPNIFSKTALEIIKEYPTAVNISKATPKKLTKIFRHIKGNNFNEEKAKFLIELSQSSIYAGRARESRALMIRANIRILELLCQEKDEIETQINNLLYKKIETIDASIENIKTIPGVSDKTISAILGECGDIKRFTSAKSFIAYLGLYPTQYQFSNSLSVGRLAKRGIPIAKHALYMAAVAAVRHNTELNKVFYDKVSASKSKKEYLYLQDPR
jgi:transposase